ncbi:MAG: hypothetical protein K1060chlam2_00368 [Chlamydiae bacterium]|nr:hypothetical protein [Chlamydiota bacterium]
MSDSVQNNNLFYAQAALVGLSILLVGLSLRHTSRTTKFWSLASVGLGVGGAFAYEKSGLPNGEVSERTASAALTLFAAFNAILGVRIFLKGRLNYAMPSAYYPVLTGLLGGLAGMQFFHSRNNRFSENTDPHGDTQPIPQVKHEE